MVYPQRRHAVILFVADVSIARVIGGAERVLFEQSTRLAQRGHHVHLLTRKRPEHKQMHENVKGVDEWRYLIDLKSSFKSAVHTLINTKRLFESLSATHDYDAINFHQPLSALGVLLSRRGRRIRKLYTCHSLSFEEYISRQLEPHSLSSKPAYLMNVYLRRKIEEFVLRHSDRILTLSQFIKQKIATAHRISPEKITVVPGGVDLERFYPAENKLIIREKFKIPADKMVLLTVRNLVPRMGLENLVHSLKRIVNTTPDVFLVIGGSGPLEKSLADLARQLKIDAFIKFAGFIPENLLPAYYQMADLFVLPTQELEGFGMVTLESLASGVPVAGTPVGGTVEILSQHDSGFLFKDTSPEAIADLILEKYRISKGNPERWRTISMECRRFVEQRYPWKKNIDALEKILIDQTKDEQCAVFVE